MRIDAEKPLYKGMNGGPDKMYVYTFLSESRCNNRKGNLTPEEARMPLLSDPGEPNYVHLVWAVRRVTPSQARYIKLFYGEEVLQAVQGL